MGSSNNNSRTGPSPDVSRERLHPWKLAGVVHSFSFRSLRWFVAANALLAVTLIGLALTPATVAAKKEAVTLHGTVESGDIELADYKVSLYIAYVDHGPRWRLLGSDTSNRHGKFEITYSLPPGRADDPSILFVCAESGPAMLASAIGQAPVGGPVVVNERTTVATGFAFAQFVGGSAIEGNPVGMLNAVRMAANMVNPKTGTVAAVLRLPPNGPETTALRTFNSLANVAASCVATQMACEDLFIAATVPGGERPTNLLQAMANIAKYPWLNVAELFTLSLEQPAYAPALMEKPDAWTLFLKFTGSFSSEQNAGNLVNGPGAFAIDGDGFLWVSNNYFPEPPFTPACAGNRVLKYYPWGENFPGSPYFGGGLSGCGWGITLTPNGRLWVGNFGFTPPPSTGCPPPPANSVSEFRPNGKPLSPDTGFTEGGINYPQGTMSDREGNIWIANCGADSVTVYPKGRPNRAFEIPILLPAGSLLPMKPFGIAIDNKGNAWVTGSRNDTLAVIGPDGKVLEVIPPIGPDGRVVLRRPMGNASDSRGNIWVANSDFMDVPCPPSPTPDLGSANHPSIALFLRDPVRKAHSGSPFTGGGLTIPWGIAVDGNDTVWVANFGFPFGTQPPEPYWPAPNRISHFCGADTSKCPPSKREVGMAISPDGTGYTSDALVRITAVAIDPSGNVWLANNWKKFPILNVVNPGGNSLAVMVGAAAPVKTPLIGPPQSFGPRDDDKDKDDDDD